MSEQVFTTHTYPIRLKTLMTKFHVIPIGDQHIHAAGHDADRYHAWLQECAKIENAHFIFLGDEFDFASSSERETLRVGKLHGSTRRDLDMTVLGRCRQYVKQHEWMKGRIIGMIEGNHTWAWLTSDPKLGFYEGKTSTQWIADKLECKWLGWLGYIRLLLCSSATSRSAIDICACHGKAGGKLLGTSINQIQDLRTIFPAADIYMMGHDHKRGAWPDSSLYLPEGGHGPAGKIKQRRQWFIRTGSWLKAYEPDVSSYVVSRLLRPAELGGVVVDCRIVQRAIDGGRRCLDPDIHVRA